MNIYVVYLFLFLGCRSDEFTCISDGKCVPRTDRCNRRRDCQDGSDESDCRKYQTLLLSIDDYKLKNYGLN